MIAQPKWFKQRKYGGWGFTPAVWQGWAYLGIIVGVFYLIQNLPMITENLRIVLMLIWGVLLSIDTIDIMIRLRKDERETIHEAFAERNAVWAMVAFLTIGISFQIAQGMVNGKVVLDPFLVATLAVGALVKSISNWYLRDK